MMKPLNITATKDTPDVAFNPKTNEFTIGGVCHPENVTYFFEPIIKWLDTYKEELEKAKVSKEIRVELFFRYINSASYKYLITLLFKLHEYIELGIPVSIDWLYEPDDYDMRDAGVELIEYSGIKIPFTCRASI